MATSAPQRTTVKLLLLVVGMFGFGFLLVPLYDVLCDITGFNGKTAGRYVATESVAVQEDRLVTVQFLAHGNSGMSWEFRPKVRTMQVHPGQISYAEYYARNTQRETMVAQAVPSVTPFHAAEYLHKTECFCFEQQQLAGGEDLLMPLRFIVDPALPKNVTTLTLSYTLYDVTELVSKVAAN